jgi:hypothetical protein
MSKTKVIRALLEAYVARIARRTELLTYSSRGELHHDLSAGLALLWRLPMRNLVLAAVTAMAIGTGAAYAHNPTSDHAAQVTRDTQVSAYGQVALATTTRERVWIYPAFRGNSDADGGQQ